MKKHFGFYALFSLIIFMGGCAAPQKSAPDLIPQVSLAAQIPPAELTAYNAAMQRKDELERPDLKQFNLAETYYQVNNYRVAALELENFVRDYPQSDRLEEALFQLGECYFQLEANDLAAKMTRDFLSQYPASRYLPLLAEREGLLSFRRSDYPVSLNTLLPLLPAAADPDYVQYAIAVCEDKTGDIATAFDNYYDLFVRNPQRRFVKDCERRLEELLQNEFSVAQIEELIQSQKYPQIESQLLFNLGLNYYQQQDYPAAAQAFTLFLDKYPKSERQAEAALWLSNCQAKIIPPPPGTQVVVADKAVLPVKVEVEAEKVPRDRIVVFAPLSGSYTKYGQELVNGVKLALSELLNQPEKPLRLVVIDTAGDRFLAKKLAAEAVAPQNVLLGIGGLFSQTTKEIAQVFEKANVPLLSPTASDTVFTYQTHNVFAAAFTNLYQAESLATYCVSKRERKKVAVLYPNDPSGVELANVFKRKAEELGGEVALEVYEPNETDFQAQIIKIKAQAPRAVFLPGKLETIKLILPQFTLYEFQPLFLGSNAWYVPELQTIPGRDLPEAVFPVVFFQESERPQIKRFLDNYWVAYGVAPDNLAALSFDFTNLFVNLYWQGNTTRDAIRDNLAKTKKYVGITGEIMAFQNGLAQKKNVLIQYQNGHWAEVEY